MRATGGGTKKEVDHTQTHTLTNTLNTRPRTEHVSHSRALRDKLNGTEGQSLWMQWVRERQSRVLKKNDTEGRFMHLSLFFCQHHVVRAVIRSCLKASQQRWLRYVRYAGYITRDTRFFQRFFWFYYHFFVGSIVCLCVSLDQWQKVFEVG